MAMTKEEFKRRWESDEHGGGITNDDCAECYVAWGLGNYPKTKSVDEVVDAVVKAAGCNDGIKDVRGKLKPGDFQELILNKDFMNVGFDDKYEIRINVKDLRHVKPLGEVDVDIVFDDKLLISKEDYEYWWSSTRRINKLFGYIAYEPKVADDVVYVVGCAELTENGIERLKVFEGTKKETIQFINEQLSERHLKSFGSDLTVFKFNYVDEDKLHPELWFSIEELAEKGIVALS